VVEALRLSRRKAVQRPADAAAQYAAMGWPVCVGAYPPGRSPRPGESRRACSCDRIGCPAPAAHPRSPAWQLEASADPRVVSHWWLAQPEANVLLATGRVFDVLDVPSAPGLAALARMQRSQVPPGPVAIGAGRALFFVATRGAPDDETEWWSCQLDCEPEQIADVAALRWHCRNSYVLAPPSRLPGGDVMRWVRAPSGDPAPDGVRLLEFLADACEESGS